jgi:hypothetical protein
MAACGPNVLATRGTVLHPMHAFQEGDTEAPRPPRVLVIERKENRVAVKHTIVGPQGRPMALTLLGEIAEIPAQHTDGGALLIEVLIFSNYKDELVDMGKYDYWLELPDGRRIKGEVHVTRGLRDHSMKITGAHMEPYLVTKDRQSGQTKVHYYVQEVENDFQLYSRWARVIFKAPGLITPETTHVIFTVKGYQRLRRYRYDFTWDPYRAMQESNKHEK